jgi:CheY-like chemotaxis protein
MKKKILIVEDNQDIIYIHRRIVQYLGYDSIVAGDGKEAVEMATSQVPDLILMDIMLPEMDGLEATRQIRKNPKTHFIPILAVTAKTTLEDKNECLQSGCDDFIAKPFLAEELCSRIEKLLKQDSA